MHFELVEPTSRLVKQYCSFGATVIWPHNGILNYLKECK